MSVITKILVSVVLILLITCVILWFSTKALRAEKNQLKTDYAQLQEIHQENVETLRLEQAERERVEKLLAKHIALQREIEKKAKADLEAKSQELARLRMQYENVDQFLRLPVPGEFVDWLRRTSSNED